MTTWVVNTSPLVFLAKLDRLNLLQQAADRIVIPEAVLGEVRAKPDAAMHAVQQAASSWLSVHQVGNREAVAILESEIGLGEAAVLALAREIHADRVVLDDLDARRLARRLGVSVIGTVGLLLAAHLQGQIDSVQGEIARLEAVGFRISSALLEAILEEAGE